MNIQEVRAKFPQYSDMSDQQLADALHGKFYSDMPKDEFYSKIGLKTEAKSEERGGLAEFGVAALRGAKSVGETVARGITSLPQFMPLRPVVEFSKQFHPDLSPTRTDDTGKAINTAGELVGAGVAGGGAGSVRQAITNVLLPAAGGVAGEQIAGEPGKIIGAIAAPAGIQAGAMAAKNAVANRASQNLQTFRQAGATPSVGQATDSVFFRGIENLAAKFPGGAGVIKKFIENQQASFGARTRTGVSAEDAGRAIERGVRGEGGFLQRFNQQQDALYNKLDQYIPKDRMVDVSRTKEALARLNADIPGAPNVSKFFKNEKIQAIEGALKKDTSGLAAAEHSMPIFQLAQMKTLPLSPADRKALFNAFDEGQLPYEAVKKLRTLVGREITDATIASSVPKSKWKALYAALSEDMGAAAKQAGHRAEGAWNLANNFTRAGMKRIEDVLDRVIGKGSQPEDIFKRFMPKDPDQANQVRAVMRSLAPEERKIVSEAIVNRLGKATAGRQDEVGSVFSSETFLTNWNKLSDAAKAQLFPNHAMRANVESIAKAASTIRQGSGVYANPSGTAGSFAAYSVYSSPIAGVATGSIVPVAAAGGAIGTAYVGAKMLTSPRVVEWLAKPVNPKQPGAAAAHLARLVSIYNDTPDDDLRKEIADFIAASQQQ